MRLLVVVATSVLPSCDHHVIVMYQILYASGNEDRCYYNFKCARPLGVLRCV